MKKIVLDTNVLLVSISEKSKLHWVFKTLIEKNYILCVSTEILSEYAEIIEQHLGSEVSESVAGIIENLSNIERVTTYYRFRLLKAEDDNKFVDCAIAANASYIVTHDKDFEILKKIDFPKVMVIDTEKFRQDLEIKT
ncbi:MAG: putative toxin-antitoxin system toxin component, PIN family [Flavobacteriaceae bacterium]|nr:MAG: putative toxin-antitoxin system toxin component, PIN family [Flavobacteriaceae bacterium]